MNLDLNKYEITLLEGWEDIYKKAQLTLWILLALKDSPKAMADIKAFIQQRTNNTITADDKSMYRALRRFKDADIVSFVAESSASGPDKKVYSLSITGGRLLQAFLHRNVHSVLLADGNAGLFS